MTGTAAAQIIPILAAPLLTRLYTPEEFGVYGICMAAMYIVSGMASGNYESAVILPKQDTEAARVVALSVLLSVAVSVLGAGLLVFLFDLINRLTDTSLTLPQMYAVIPMFLLFSVYQTLNYWLIRKGAYGHLSMARISRSTAMVLGNLLIGFFGIFDNGLIVGSLIGQGVAVSVLLVRILRRDRKYFLGISFRSMLEQAKKYKDFPLYALPSNLINTVTHQMPVFFLNKFFGEAAAGYFTFTQTVVNTPLSFVSSSVLDVFKQKAAKDYQEQGNFRKLYVNMVKGLTAVSLPVFLTAALFAPLIFAVVFGDAWRPAGEMTRILSLMYFFKFIVSPLSYSYYIVGKQKEDFLWHTYILVSTFLCLASGMYVADYEKTLLLFSANYALIYIIYFIRSYKFSGGVKISTAHREKAY